MGHAGLSRYSWATFGVTLLTILSGGFVRASGSGAGCGANWPLCGAEVVPSAENIATIIEFSHRVVSGVCFLMVVLLFFFCRLSIRKPHPARVAAAYSLVFVISEVLIGAGLVLFGLVDKNASPLRTVVVALHLVNSMLLLGSLVLCSFCSSIAEPKKNASPPLLLWPFVAGLLGLLIISASGAVSALSVTLFPSESLSKSVMLELSERAHMLVRLRSVHIVLGSLAGFAAWFLGRRLFHVELPPGLKIRLITFYALLLMQVVVGVFSLWLLGPLALQMLHLLLGALLWSLLTLITAQVYYEEQAMARPSCGT